MFDTIADNAPVRNPACIPYAMPVMITIAVTGLNPGMGAKMSRPTTEIAVITAMTTSSRAPVFPFSKPIKKGTHTQSIYLNLIVHNTPKKVLQCYGVDCGLL